ncbi:poly(hydroxyalkanoate) depolymerase family esterase [Kibdelosporangium banguiense]|uniref:Poly(Hydroxyalkanoate) depolymerase family esterase n=1 Tax=Kibdelosporangium banguiense TaxID=1365924 RepID=A0ABS4TKX8_9PSEU|nr:PHB depolymerase family esterase [Kibdelosporangium banguiense]MBP2325063.1 poly(hydroxyalkanoate) depolymerase family esterase [Kibdelosporangium banguiense]
MLLRVFIAFSVLAGLAFGATPASATVLVPDFGSNPGNLVMYRHTPSSLPAGRPVVVALHGCTQNAAGYGDGSGWAQLADQMKFTLVLPEQKSVNNFNKCFNWFERGDTTRGQGEAESVAQMVRRARDDAGAARVYVTGLSAGGAMTAVMLAAYPELFTGGGIVAGLAYRCASSMIEAFSCMHPGRNLSPGQLGDSVRAASSHAGPWPTVSIWQGTADYTVSPSNATELVEQWTNVHGVPAVPTETGMVAGYPHARYGSVVETYTITGMGHGQPVDPGTCGQAGAYFLDVDVCAAGRLSDTWQLGVTARGGLSML